MLKYFFGKDQNNIKGDPIDIVSPFEGLAIMNAGEQYLSHMGKYPVIFLTLKTGKQPDFELAYDCLIDEIAQEFHWHRYVLEGTALSDEQKKTFCKILRKECRIKGEK